MDPETGQTTSPFSAGCDADSCEKTSDAPQTEKKELDRDRNESLIKNQGRQTSISGKQKTVHEKFSEEGVQDPQNISSAQSVRDIDRLHHQQSPDPSGLYFGQLHFPVCSIETKGDVGERQGQDLTTTTVMGVRHVLRSAPRSSDHLRRSLPCNSSCFNPDSFFITPSYSLFSAQYDADSCEKTSDTLEAKKKELNEDRMESLIKDQGGQTSDPDRQKAADEVFPEKRVRGKLPSKGVCRSQNNSSSTSLRRFRSLCDNDCKRFSEALLVPPPPSPPPNKCISSAQSIGNTDGLQPQKLFELSHIYYDHLQSIWSPVCKEKKELNEDRNDSLIKNQGSQTSYSVKRITEDEECSRLIFQKNMRLRSRTFRRVTRQNMRQKDSCSLASTDESPDYLLGQPPPGTHTETAKVQNPSSVANATPEADPDNTRKTGSDQTVAGSPLPQGRSGVLHDSNICSEGSREQGAFMLMSVQSESDVPMEREASVTAVNSSVTNTLPAHSHLQSFSDSVWRKRDSGCLPRSHSVPSLSQIPSASNKTFTRANSLPDMFKTSIKEFTPDIDEDDETFRFQSSCPGLYQCSVTGLVFHMDGEGDVVYRIVPWNRRLLARHHKRPAGPRFDIKCLQQSVRQLHLPHCEIRSTGGCDSLSVAHEDDEGIEFIAPHEITETHVIINITGFSAFGNVKDEDSPPDPVRALVLLFYSPPVDPDVDFFLNVLLLPRNIMLHNLLRSRRKLFGDECFIQTSPQCILHPEQEYTLSTFPEDDSILVQPTEGEFDCENYDNYFPTFQVSWETMRKHIKLLLRESKSSHSVWERQVCLSSTGVRRSCGSSALNLPSSVRLFEVRSSFVNGISGPVLKSLLDKLLEKKVMTDSERESVDGIQNHRDKARFVIDTVRKKGDAASSEMIEFLCEMDPFLCEHLGLL